MMERLWFSQLASVSLVTVREETLARRENWTVDTGWN